MITFFTVILTAALLLDCLVLILLVMVQLPKKEAGAAMAFGGGATDALFGAGSGNALTRITKWAAGFFFALAFLLSILSGYSHSTANRDAAFKRQVEQAQKAKAAAETQQAPAPAPATTTTASNAPSLMTTPNATAPAASSNAPAPTPEAPAPK